MLSSPDVVIVSYRRPAVLQRCLESVRTYFPTSRVLVWDNASEDSDEIRKMAHEWPAVTWTFSATNIGFAAAVNRLMRAVTSEAALLLNPDATLLSNLPLTRAALANPGVAAAAPWLKDGHRRAWDNAHRQPNLLRELVSYAGWEDRLGRLAAVSGLYAEPPTTVSGYLTGACLLVSMSAWRAVGEFDERFFLYAEEADWCRRANQRGLVLASAHEMGAQHSAGGTVVDSTAQSSRSRALLDQNRRRYLTKHSGPLVGRTYELGTALLDRIQLSKRRASAHGKPRPADFVITTPTLDFGGAERQRVQLANELAARGHSVTLRVLQHGGGLENDLTPAVKLEVADYRQVHRDAGSNTLLVTGTTRIECAHGLAWRTINRPRGRWVVANHVPPNLNGPTFERDKVMMMRFCDGIIHLARIHRDQHQKFTDLDHGKYWIIPNGVPLYPRRSRGNARSGKAVRFVVASRLEPHKQIDLLIRAVSSGMDDVAWTLDIWGDGSARTDVEAAIPPHLTDRIHLRGWTNDVLGVFADADVYCLPSRAEAQPMVILEAMEAGLCVLSSPVASVPEVLSNGAGVLVDPPDEEGWRAALRLVIEDVEFRTRTAEIGRDRVEAEYSLAAMTDRYEAMRADLGLS